MKYYIIAGEASGDLHASNLIKEIIKIDNKAIVRAWGGDLMHDQGAEIVKHYRELAFMGFAEVIENLPQILRNIRFCKKNILDFAPDVLILVDYPGFNLRMAKFAKSHNIKVVYYISPQIWAWKKGRIHSIKRDVDKMLVILPFEKDFYHQNDMHVDFVGHPLLDAIEGTTIEPSLFRARNDISDKPIIALLPGSRKQEIKEMLSVMLTLVDEYIDYQFVIGGAPSIESDFFNKIIGDRNVKIVFGETHLLLKNAKAALVTSGTATLEAALLKVPEIVCYKGNPISYAIAKRLVHLKYISLVNLIMDSEVVKELIQNDLTKDNLSNQLKMLLADSEKLKTLLDNYDQLIQKLGGSGASANAAKIICDQLLK